MKKPKIMIVDDNKLILEITGELFENAGFDVIKRNNPIGTTAAISSEQPDCLLLDLNMPVLSGERLVDLIKQNNKSTVKIILHSDRSDDELRRAAEETGADAYVSKRMKKSLIIEKVKEVISFQETGHE